MGETAIARFCQETREYAYQLGKRNFFLFGELVAGDDAINRYSGPNTSGHLGSKTVYYGLDSVLDFPLFWTLPGAIKGYSSPMDLINRYESLRDRALNRGELGRYLVTFLDNHDQIGQMYKRRFSAGAYDEQIIASVGYLLCALGTPCIYYGTEQGLSGEGPGDEFIRETLFDLENPEGNLLNEECRIYREIAAIAKVNREHPALRFGRMYYREISGDGNAFGLPKGQPCVLAFSRILAKEELLIAYNTSTTDVLESCIMVDSALHNTSGKMKFLYGSEGETPVIKSTFPDHDFAYVKLALKPMQFVILG
jgi:alpha-amylase